MLSMVSTLETSQFPIGWLNWFALKNIRLMFVTFETVQLPICWLNAVAFENISSMV